MGTSASLIAAKPLISCFGQRRRNCVVPRKEARHQIGSFLLLYFPNIFFWLLSLCVSTSGVRVCVCVCKCVCVCVWAVFVVRWSEMSGQQGPADCGLPDTTGSTGTQRPDEPFQCARFDTSRHATASMDVDVICIQVRPRFACSPSPYRNRPQRWSKKWNGEKKR